MGEFDSIEEILEFAISREAEANRFYLYLAERIENPAMREMLVEFAKEELEHKATLELELMKEGFVITEAAREKLADFDISNYYIADVDPKLDIDYEDLLVLAMKKEKLSFRLYIDLAAMVRDKTEREVLLSLAEEEARHKMSFEIEYDELTKKK